jgi:hypothetical protein
MWYNLTAGDETVFMDSDGSFNLERWKDTLDVHVSPLKADGTSIYNDSIASYVQDRLLLGHNMLDDIAIFNPDVTQAQIDAIAAHSKRRLPALPTIVRYRPTQLKGVAEPCSTCPGGKKPYAVLDMGWAQYHQRNGSPAVYRDTEIQAAKDLHLGLMLGLNVRKGMYPSLDEVPPDSIVKWGSILLEPGESDYACSFLMWDAAYSNLNSSAFSTLANVARNHVAASCKHPSR